MNDTIFECDDDNDNDVSRDRNDQESTSGSESDSDGIILNFDKKPNTIKKKREINSSQPEAKSVSFPESEASFRPISKVPTVATDQEIAAVLESRQKKTAFASSTISPRKARAMRRKLYLDLYKEVSSKMLI